MRRKKDTVAERLSLREKLADSFDSSKEIFLDVPRIILLGNKEVSVENYRGITEYTDSLLVLATNPHMLRIEGNGLEVKTINQDMVYITGSISKVEFCKEA